MNKILRFKVKAGERTVELVYQKFNDITDPSENICDTRCPYRWLCEHLPDPENLEDTKRGFLDFCGELGGYETKISGLPEEEDSFWLVNAVPVEGSLEKSFEAWPEFMEVFNNQEKYESPNGL